MNDDKTQNETILPVQIAHELKSRLQAYADRECEGNLSMAFRKAARKGLEIIENAQSDKGYPA